LPYRFPCYAQMHFVNRIERSAENSYFHDRSSRRE
jgi:hypothetical protein